MPDPKSINCAHCGNSTTSAGTLPKFCSHCGGRFESTVGDPVAGSTDQQSPDQTNAAPSSANSALDETQDSSSFVIRPAGSAGKLEPGSQIGPFTLGCQLGAGGMGTVYEAHDTESDLSVALKILSKQVRTTVEGVERFRRESQVAASINHPRSTFVYRSGQYGDQFFIAMELMNGGTLKDIVEEEGPLEVSRAVDFMIQAIDGLAVAHEVGIVHRDFKPSNCFVDDDGRAKVGDFGLAKNFFGDVALTQTGVFVGTPQFAAPEQLRAGRVDARTDIYAVAGTLFYLLTGRAPFIGDAAQVISGIAAEQAPNIKTIAPHIPEKLAKLLATMLEKDPARRPASLEEIRVKLLPFSSLGAVAPDSGLRMAAFFIDMFIYGFIAFGISLISAPLQLLIGPARSQILVALINSIGLILWFAGQEYFTGTTIGKWLFKMRVVNDQNDTPNLLQALFRATLIPGSRSLLTTLPMIWIGGPSGEQIEAQDMLKIGLMELVAILSWAPCMLMMLPARISNCYRGFHDRVTGSRVVRISGALEEDRSSQRPVTAPIPVEPESIPTETIKPFRVLGQIGSNANTHERVLVGEDSSLERNVWVYETTREAPPLTRAGIRPARQRIIASRKHESDNPDRHFFVAESIEGLPLQQFITSSGRQQWTTFRPLLRDLAAELERALDEDSLPDEFGVDNIWLDRSGQLKLVEIAVGENRKTARGRDVFDQLFMEIVQQQPVPEHVIHVQEKWHGASDISLGQIVDELDEMTERPSSWTWIDRMGAASVSMAIELSLLFLLGQAWLWLFFVKLEMSIPATCGTFLVAMLAAAFFTGYFFESPSFWFQGITVRKRDKRHSPSRFRLGCRMLVSWIPLTLMAVGLVGVQGYASKGMENPDAIIVGLAVCGLLMPVSAGLMLAVTLYNLARPSRGVADLICGTLLMRK